ncbi:unnamed protein product [Phyllotreta striolata]|uniref:Tudor domain-containing protein 7 n=1 Tax=Phyllotreta striolata TaxID=444603 RepID=A0A9N9XMP6_PHYSR|nr:unnamed protein product [Phyllotreta striolata]
MEAVISCIRGVLVCSKHPMLLRQLENEYRQLLGDRIPYAQFGYKSLEEFLSSDPSLRLLNNNGDLYVQALLKAESAHIVKMKMKEKTKTKKPTSRGKLYARAPPTAKWQPHHKSHKAKYAKTTRPGDLSFNQFVNYKAPSVPSKVVLPENSSLNQRNVPPRFQKQSAPAVSKWLQVQDVKQESSNNARNGHYNNNNNNFVADRLKKTAQDCCSPGVSRRKTISKMMSEVSLEKSERDSGTSSPISDDSACSVGFSPNPKVPEFVPVGDPKVDLKNFVEYHKLGTIEITTANTKKHKMFLCKIQIGNHKYTSYPEECRTEQEAESFCVREAYKDLTEKYGRRKSLVLACDKDILERIPKMLEKHNGGIWEWQLQMDYCEKYHEQLPEDWLKIIDSSPCIHVQKVVDNYTLRYCKPDEALQKGGPASPPKSMTLTDVSVPSSTIEFSEDGKLWAEVQYVASAGEVWCAQIDTDESAKFHAMCDKMEAFYAKHKASLRAQVVNRDGYYVVERDDGSWARVRALEVIDDGERGRTVSCFYIDSGEEEAHEAERLYQLKRQFAICQAQAFVCRLAGLEDLYEISNYSEALLRILFSSQFILEVASDLIADDDKVPPVYMYNAETGQSVNEELLHTLTMESASPNLTTMTIVQVYVSHVASNGDLYVQVRTRGFERLLQLLDELEAQIEENPPVEVLEPLEPKTSRNRLYFGRSAEDDRWYRLKIIDWSPNQQMAQIHYVDYGHTAIIEVKSTVLYPLDKLDDVLNVYPLQAVKTRMVLEELPADFVAVTSKVMTKEEPVIMKIIRFDDEGTPLAEFFRRNADESLLCINKSIAMENELTRNSDNGACLKRKTLLNAKNSKNVPSGGKLGAPPLPRQHECFEIHVPFAVNPYNFFVQPLESQQRLHELMERLQERYGTVLYSPLTIDEVAPGNIYASKFTDGNWYRTSVIKVIHSGSISVFYCDFGYYANVTLQQLIPLDVEFMELPYQAIKAKLAGIKPKHSNWTMEHCEEFKKTVERKHFYSILLKIEKDELYESDIVLNLMLIDTSSPEDVYIEKELIRKGIAAEA